MDQKLENILNLALETPEEEREQTESLNVGYSAEIRSWELIVKYHGSLDRLREQNIVVEELIAGYAILTVPEALVDTVSDTPEIEYVEKPKRFYYGQTFPAGTSCFPPVTMRTPFLNGRGVLWLYWIPGSPGIWRCSGRQMAVRGYVIYGTRQSSGIGRCHRIRQCRRKQVMWDMEKCRMDLSLGRNIPRRK